MIDGRLFLVQDYSARRNKKIFDNATLNCCWWCVATWDGRFEAFYFTP